MIYYRLCTFRFKNITFFDLKTAEEVENAYNYFNTNGGINIFVEYPQLYNK